MKFSSPTPQFKKKNPQQVYKYIYIYIYRDRGGTLVKVLCYKSEGNRFDPSYCQWIFNLHKILPIALWPGVDSASNKSEYQEHFLGVKAADA